MAMDEKKAKIRAVIEELRSQSVSHETFRPFHQKAFASLQTIDAQIESIEEQYRRAQSNLEEVEEDPQVEKALKEQSWYPHRYVEALKEKFELQEQFVTWSGVAQHIARIAMDKYAEALSESRALDIERDAMQRFAEYQGRQESFHKEQVLERLKVHEDTIRRELDWFKKEAIGILADLARETGSAEAGVRANKLRFPQKTPVEQPESGEISAKAEKTPDTAVSKPETTSRVPSKAKSKLDSLGFSDDFLGEDEEEDDDR